MTITNTPTPITSLDNVIYVGSPKHILCGSTIGFNRVKLYLWVWSGAVTLPYPSAPATFTLEKSLVSTLDTGIIIEISDYIKPFIKPLATFENQITAVNEGVYYQYNIEFFEDASLVDTQYSTTKFATLGYNWYWEGEQSFTYNKGSFNFTKTNIEKYYYAGIKYTNTEIDLSGVTDSSLMIKRTLFTPPDNLLRCTEIPCIIIYLNKQGYYDVFNVTGNIDFVTDLNRESYTKGVRNPVAPQRQQFHGTTNYNITSVNNFIVNTGLISEDMGMLIEEILHSESVYLIIFDGGIKVTGGTTVDTTFITVDNTIITVDSELNGLNASSYRQIPVNVTDSSFIRMTSLKDKAKIDYTLEFTEANNKRNNIRS